MFKKILLLTILWGVKVVLYFRWFFSEGLFWQKLQPQVNSPNNIVICLICVLVLLKYVVLSDKRIKKVEMTFVRSYILSEFGSNALELGTKVFIDLEDANNKTTFKKICNQINENTKTEERIQLIHLLFKAANTDKVFFAK